MHDNTHIAIINIYELSLTKVTICVKINNVLKSMTHLILPISECSLKYTNKFKTKEMNKNAILFWSIKSYGNNLIDFAAVLFVVSLQ